jgi:ribonuclease D
MQPILIQTNDALIHCLNDIAEQNHIFLDTEFIREKTYYPILCLIQIYASGDKVYLIDVLSAELDLVPFMDYLKNPNLLKVFHSGRQDIEIFYHDFGFIPMPLFDTQIAAGYLGYGDSAGFESIVKSTQDIAIDKSQQRTNWLNRPLNHKQILYAASDVYYLAPLFHILSEQLTTQNRHSWIQAELSVLTSENTYKPNIDNLLKRFKYRSNNPVQIIGYA